MLVLLTQIDTRISFEKFAEFHPKLYMDVGGGCLSPYPFKNLLCNAFPLLCCGTPQNLKTYPNQNLSSLRLRGRNAARFFFENHIVDQALLYAYTEKFSCLLN